MGIPKYSETCLQRTLSSMKTCPNGRISKVSNPLMDLIPIKPVFSGNLFQWKNFDDPIG